MGCSGSCDCSGLAIALGRAIALGCDGLRWVEGRRWLLVRRVQRVSAELRSLRRQCPPSHPPRRSTPVPEAIGADGPRRFLTTRRVDGQFRPGQDQAQRQSDSPAPVPLHQAIGLQRGRDPGLDPLRDQEDRERQDLASRSQALAHRLGFRLLLQLSLWIWV
nr:hypothetical protein CFP56_47202 [Quercus suber]